MYWDDVEEMWSQTGLHITSCDPDKISCTSDHLTNFAVLMVCNVLRSCILGVFNLKFVKFRNRLTIWHDDNFSGLKTMSAAYIIYKYSAMSAAYMIYNNSAMSAEYIIYNKSAMSE